MISKVLVSTLLLGSLQFWMNGCSEVGPSPEVDPCQKKQLPVWVNDPYVGVSRITASGLKSDQRKIALQRAIGEMLMHKGSATGSSEIAIEKEHILADDSETLHKRLTQRTDMIITHEKRRYSVNVTDIWRDPCTQELYVKIKEK